MMRWLDRITGKVTMYRLVLICLLALLVESLLLSLTSGIPYSPLAILATAAIAVAVSYASNWLFAIIFRVKPHSESSLITGLILFMLFIPEFEGAQLLAIAVAALCASASKYILAIRRRHVFNPAAAGAFIAGLIVPTNPATWWIATPWLLPLVIVASFVILFRTRHLLIGVVAIVVAAASVIGTQLSFGTTFPAALSTAFVSYPIIYFVGFMFSEPLTLAPRRWQQLVEAVVVGVLFGLIFHIGPVLSSFQLALLVGNLLAFLVGQRRGIRLEYLGRQKLDSSSWEFSFRPSRPVTFSAGQYMEFTLPHQGADVRGLRRVFSIASAPAERDELRFGLRVAERSSSFKSTLLELQPGQTISATAVGGDFVLPRRASEPVLLVAGGIGITPFISHLEQIEKTGEQRDVVLVYAASSSDDLAYASRLDAAGHRVLLVAPSAPEALPAAWTYLGSGPVTAELLLRALPDAKSRHAYVSGPPGLVRDLKPALRKAGLRRVHSDYFSGY